MSISLFQTATNEIPGVSRSLRTDSELFRSKSCKVPKPPDSFTVVRPTYLPATSANIPDTTEDVSKQMIPDDDTIADTMMKETNCLLMVITISGRKLTCSTQQATVSHVIDVAALVNILQPGKELKTFDQYYSNTFAPHLTKQVTTVNVTRLDVVWDTYVKK